MASEYLTFRTVEHCGIRAFKKDTWKEMCKDLDSEADLFEAVHVIFCETLEEWLWSNRESAEDARNKHEETINGTN